MRLEYYPINLVHKLFVIAGLDPAIHGATNA
jgi:hypothetical protein